MTPQARRRAAGRFAVGTALAAVPVSVGVPVLLDDVWFQIAVLFLSMLALVLPAVDIWLTTDVRVKQESGDAGAS